MATRKKPPPPPPKRRAAPAKPAARRPVMTVGAEPHAPPPPPLTWSEWYNTKASEREQTAFDRAAASIDAGAEDDRKLRGETPFVEALRGTVLYLPLLDYVKTGGRLAMFFQGKRVYAKTPLSGIRSGGPVERLADVVVLHPGLYSYTDVTRNGDAFQKWLTDHAGTVTVLRENPSEVVIIDKPYFTNYALLVGRDTAWEPDLATYGSPTWLPPGTGLLAYWKNTDPAPSSDLAGIVAALKEGAEGVSSAAKTAMTVITVLGAAYLVHELKPVQKG